MHAAGVIDLLAEYATRYPDEAATVARFDAFVRSERRCFDRDCWSGHVTGSAWLVDANGARVLLTHHRKLDRWLQLGGHSDGDDDPLRVACREAEEESGIHVEPVSRELFDIDIHAIPSRNSDPEHYHFDLRFALRVSGDEAFSVSNESRALAWVTIDDIASYTTEASVLRMARKWRADTSAKGL